MSFLVSPAPHPPSSRSSEEMMPPCLIPTSSSLSSASTHSSSLVARTFKTLSFSSGDAYSGQLVEPRSPLTPQPTAHLYPSHTSTDSERDTTPPHTGGSHHQAPTLHGVGVLSHKDGTQYKGEFRNGVKHGLGVTTFANGDKHVGEYRNNLYEGHGTYTSGDGCVAYVGGFSRGEFDGTGVMKVVGTKSPSPLNLSESGSVVSATPGGPGETPPPPLSPVAVRRKGTGRSLEEMNFLGAMRNRNVSTERNWRAGSILGRHPASSRKNETRRAGPAANARNFLRRKSKSTAYGESPIETF